MENSVKKCPKCPYESQCDIILRHHIKGLHKSPLALQMYDAQNPAMCMCEDCVIEAELKSNLLKHLGVEPLPPPPTPDPPINNLDDYEEEMMEVSVSPELTETIFLEVYDDEDRDDEGDMVDDDRQEEPDPGSYYCAKCEFKTTNKSALIMHVKHKHNMNFLPADIEWFECGYCSFKSLDGDCTVDHVHKVHANQ